MIISFLKILPLYSLFILQRKLQLVYEHRMAPSSAASDKVMS